MDTEQQPFSSLPSLPTPILCFAEKHRRQDRFPYPFSSPTPSLVFPEGSTFWSCMEPCGCDFWGTRVGVPSCIARKEMLNSPRWTLEKEACRKSPSRPPPLFHCLQGGPGDLEDGLERELQNRRESPLCPSALSPWAKDSTCLSSVPAHLYSGSVRS